MPPFASESCTRYLSYARRVQHITLRPALPLLSDDEYAAILSCFDGQERYLLPNLRTFYLDTWKPTRDGFDNVIPYLAPPNAKFILFLAFENDLDSGDSTTLVSHLIQYHQLSSLELGEASPGFERSSLRQVLLHSPQLISLSLSELQTHNEFIVDAIEKVRPEIQVLICNNYEETLLERILRVVHSSLIDLQVKGAMQASPSARLQRSFESGFPALRQCAINLDDSGAALWEAITCNSPLPALQSLSLSLPDDRHHVLTNILTGYLPTLGPQLSHLTISITWRGSDQVSTQTMNAVDQLLNICPNVTHLCLLIPSYDLLPSPRPRVYHLRLQDLPQIPFDKLKDTFADLQTLEVQLEDTESQILGQGANRVGVALQLSDGNIERWFKFGNAIMWVNR